MQGMSRLMAIFPCWLLIRITRPFARKPLPPMAQATLGQLVAHGTPTLEVLGIALWLALLLWVLALGLLLG